MAKSTSQQIIKHFNSLLKNDTVQNMIIANDGKLNGAMCKQAQDILNSDGSFSKVSGGVIEPKGGNLVLTLETEGRGRPQYVLMTRGIR